MNFRISIKQTLARIYCAKKKKDLKVTVGFKKELIPFLAEMRNSGVIYKFVLKKGGIEISLKKEKILATFSHKQKAVRSFDINSSLYKNPTLLLFISTTQGILTNGTLKNQTKVLGGTQLFLIN